MIGSPPPWPTAVSPPHGAASWLSLMLAAALWLVWYEQAVAKEPGRKHCYRSVCVRVLDLNETARLLGSTLSMTASHYGDPSVDPFNRGEFTSNGERFYANDATRTASANFPDGTELLLRNPLNGHVSHVRVNDFGPFWVNRELDVTERVADDLGFKRRGIIRLEVTVVAVPTADDVKALYRRDRHPRPALGHVGVRTPEETVRLAQLLISRPPADQPVSRHARKSNSATLRVAVPLVHREYVYAFVPAQPHSPRAAGAEALDASIEVDGARAIADWRARRHVARTAEQAAVFSAGLLALLVLLGPVVAIILRRMQRVIAKPAEVPAHALADEVFETRSGELLRRTGPEIVDWTRCQVDPLFLPSRAPRVDCDLRHGIWITGDIASRVPVHLSGHVSGCVRAPLVVIAPTGVIHGDIFADEVFVEGKIVGAVSARRVQMCDTALIEGDVSSAALTMAPGAILNGSVRTSAPPLPISPRLALAS